MLIRRALADDAAAIVDLREEAARWLAGRGIEQWRPGEASVEHVLGWLTTGRLYVAEQADRIVGAVRVAWSDSLAWGPEEQEEQVEEQDAGYIHALMAARSIAGQGVGRELLNHAEKVIAATGRPLARLDCVAANAVLVGYYTARGYTVVGVHEFPPGTGLQAVTLLEKRLS